MLAETIAQAYLDAPIFDKSVAHHWHVLRKDTLKLFRMIQSKLDVSFVAGQPYATAKEMARKTTETGSLLISTDFARHPIFDIETNCQFRTVHDYCHIMARFNFGLIGEIKTFHAQALLVSREALPALFTEIVGQTCVHHVSHAFPVQKIARLRPAKI